MGADDHLHRNLRDVCGCGTGCNYLRMRAPGMSLNRIPMYCWSMLVQSLMVMFAMPAVMIASTVMLLNDRTIGTHFVNPAEGGDPLLYQHMFWFFGHPEVYIIFLPALGFVSSIIEAHTRSGRYSVIPRWFCRSSRTDLLPSGSGSIICSQPGCPRSAKLISLRQA